MNNDQIEAYITQWQDGELSDEKLEEHAYELYTELGRYLYRTVPDERPDGVQAMKDEAESYLKEKRAARKNRQLEKRDEGFARFGE